MLLWYKWSYWKQGIPARMFWKEKMDDILDVMYIEGCIAEKNMSQKRINKLISNVRH
jgi:hypothetical protein